MAYGKVQTAVTGGKIGGNKPFVVRKAGKSEDQSMPRARAEHGIPGKSKGAHKSKRSKY